jgi:hypothetical protein
MGFCLYVAGGIFIHDIKLGLSIFSTPIGLLENVTILVIEAYQCLESANILVTTLIRCSRSATATKCNKLRISPSCNARYWCEAFNYEPLYGTTGA